MPSGADMDMDMGKKHRFGRMEKARKGGGMVMEEEENEQGREEGSM